MINDQKGNKDDSGMQDAVSIWAVVAHNPWNTNARVQFDHIQPESLSWVDFITEGLPTVVWAQPSQSSSSLTPFCSDAPVCWCFDRLLFFIGNNLNVSTRREDYWQEFYFLKRERERENMFLL